MKIVRFENGTASVMPNPSAETPEPEPMHSAIGAWEEAQTLYAQPSHLKTRGHASPVILFDIGMGIAANALAAIEDYERAPHKHPLIIHSFELHLDPLRLALQNLTEFPFLQRNSERIEILLDVL